MKRGHLEGRVSSEGNMLYGESGLYFQGGSFDVLQPWFQTTGAIKTLSCFKTKELAIYNWLAGFVPKEHKVHNLCFVQSFSPCYEASFSSLFSSFLCPSSCSLYVSTRPEALLCSGPRSVWLLSTYLFQATWRQNCRTRKVLISRARSTSLPLTARWKSSACRRKHGKDSQWELGSLVSVWDGLLYSSSCLTPGVPTRAAGW